MGIEGYMKLTEPDRIEKTLEGYTVHFVGKNGSDVIRLKIKGDIALMEMSTSPPTNRWRECAFAYKRAYDFVVENNLKDSR